MFRKLLITIILGALLFIPCNIWAIENTVNLYFFWSKTCPHCAKEKTFLQGIVSEYPNLVVRDYEISSAKNAFLLDTIGKALHIETSGVPIIFVGNSYFVGYLDDQTTGKTIRTLIEKTAESGDPDAVGAVIRQQATSSMKDIHTDATSGSIPQQLSIPIFGKVDIRNLSLPILTIVIAFLDGFNPCAMWTLLFLISLLLGMQDRKRMWILGITFIVSSAVVYFLFLSAWLNFFLFLGFVIWVRIAIGLVALIAGGYYLRDYYINRSGACNVMGNEKRQRVFEKLREITQKKQFLFAIAGMILLAFAVNMVELICSAGLPAIYTQILSLSKLPAWQYYLYLVLYIVIFMLDDLIIFFTAMITLHITGIQSKYSRLSHLLGGILMLIIGLLLLFKPEWLMFG